MRKVMIIGMLIALAGVANAEWLHDKSENLMEGTVSYLTYTPAEASQGTLRNPALVIRRTGEQYETFIFWGGYNMDRDTIKVDYRVGDGEVKAWSAALSSDKEGTFLRRPVDFISMLLTAEENGERIVVQAERSTDIVSVARFDLTGFADALLRVEERE